MDGSNTAVNSRKASGKPFVKGDPRINRKGRPKDFDALRELAKQIAHEPVYIGGKKFTVIETILRQWAASKNQQLQKAFIEIAYGKVPEAIDVTSKGEKLYDPSGLFSRLLPEIAGGNQAGTVEKTKQD